MNDSSAPGGAAGPESGDLSREEMESALFAQLVIQQANLAMMLMGRAPRPDGSESVRDLEAARLFIDQLELLEVKTRGNLNAHEAALLKQSLMTLRLAFVEAVETRPESTAPAPAPASAAPPPGSPDKTASETGADAAEEESRKRFSKKY